MSSLAVKEVDRVDLTKEKITLDELAEIYGIDMVDFIIYCIDNDYLDVFVEIQSPQEYKQIVELYLEYVVRFEGFDKYEKLIKLYNEDSNSRFYYTKQIYQIYNRRYSLFAKSKNPYLSSDDRIKSKKFETIKKENDDGITFDRERYLEESLLQNLPLPDLDYQLHRQKKMPFGTVDVLVTSNQGRSLIEFKKENAKRKDVYQIYDYWASENKKQRKKTEKILVGKDATTDVLELCDLLDVGYYRCEPSLSTNSEDIFLRIEKLSKRKTGHFDTIIDHINSEHGGYILVPHPSFTERIDKVIKKHAEGIRNRKKEHKIAMKIIREEHKQGKFFAD